MPLEEVIAANLEALFPGMEILEHGVFRVTRDADLEISDEAGDLLEAVEEELRRRRFGETVRVEVGTGMSDTLRDQIVARAEREERQVYEVDGLLDATDLMQIVELPGLRRAARPAVDAGDPAAPAGRRRRVDFLAEMRAGDMLVHHPYDSFSSSVERFVHAGGPSTPTSSRSS